MNDTFGAAFGRLVKRKRAGMRMTQGQLACALYPKLAPADAEGRKRDISKLETGKVPNPTTATVQKLADALGITDKEIDALQHRVQTSSMSGQLDNIPTLSREKLEDLSARFGIENAYDKPDEELRGYLTDKANDYRTLRQQIAALDETVAQIAELKAKATAAAEAGDLEEVEHILAAADILETAENAKTKRTRAQNALLRNRPEQAFEILSAIADSFRSAGPLVPAQIRAKLFGDLYYHGLRYGGIGLSLAEKMLKDAAALLPTDAPDELLPLVFGNLALTRDAQATRLAGPQANEKFNEAISSYRDLISRLPKSDPHWATAQNNLGNALSDQGTRTGGEDDTRLLAEAITAYRDALTVYTRDDHPVDWATTLNNLGTALSDQGTRTSDEDGTRLLAEAVAAYRNALTVRTRDDHPVQWATTQNNLGNALKDQGIRTGGEECSRLFAEAVTAYRDALTVRTREDQPVKWGMTLGNLAIAEQAIAEHETTSDPRAHLEAALAHIDAALTVYDPEHMPYDHGTATRLRDRILEALKNAKP